MQVASELGFAAKSAELQWWAVAMVAALYGVSPERLTRPRLDAGRDELIAASVRSVASTEPGGAAWREAVWG